MVPLPDGSGFVSCSADHNVKFWEWEVTTSAAAAANGAAGNGSGSFGARRLASRHVRTLKMADDVLCARISPDGRLIAVSLLDSTIQVIARSRCTPCEAVTLVLVRPLSIVGSGAAFFSAS